MIIILDDHQHIARSDLLLSEEHIAPDALVEPVRPFVRTRDNQRLFHTVFTIGILNALQYLAAVDLFDIPERQIEHRDIDNPGRKHAAHQCRVEQDARSILLAHHLLELHIGHVAVPAHLFGIERRTALHTHRRQLGTVPYDNQPTTASLTHVTNQVVEQISRPECRRIERVVGQHGCLIDDKHRIFFAVVIE